MDENKRRIDNLTEYSSRPPIISTDVGSTFKDIFFWQLLVCDISPILAWQSLLQSHVLKEQTKAEACLGCSSLAFLFWRFSSFCCRHCSSIRFTENFTVTRQPSLSRARPSQNFKSMLVSFRSCLQTSLYRSLGRSQFTVHDFLRDMVMGHSGDKAKPP